MNNLSKQIKKNGEKREKEFDKFEQKWRIYDNCKHVLANSQDSAEKKEISDEMLRFLKNYKD